LTPLPVFTAKGYVPVPQVAFPQVKVWVLKLKQPVGNKF